MTTWLSPEEVARRIGERFPDAVERQDATGVWVKPELLPDVARFLHDDPSLDFRYLNCLTAVDYVDHFDVVYHLTSLTHNHSAVIKVTAWGREDPTVPSVVSVWRGADLYEREAWDLMGVRFEGHPNLKRLLLWEGFPGHPLRKDFKDVVEY